MHDYKATRIFDPIISKFREFKNSLYLPKYLALKYELKTTSKSINHSMYILCM
jgi:hypothetical protein